MVAETLASCHICAQLQAEVGWQEAGGSFAENEPRQLMSWWRRLSAVHQCRPLPNTSRFPCVSLVCSAKETVPSRAYLNLRDSADVPRFKAAWDGRTFVSERGAQYRWVSLTDSLHLCISRARLRPGAPSRRPGRGAPSCLRARGAVPVSLVPLVRQAVCLQL